MHFVLLLPSGRSIREYLMDCPWYPSENAQMDVCGPIPSSRAPAICFLVFFKACWYAADIGFFAGTRPYALRHGSTTRSWLHQAYCHRVVRPQARRLSQESRFSTGRRGDEIGGTSCMDACTCGKLAIAVPTGCSESEPETHFRGTVTVDDCWVVKSSLPVGSVR